MPFAIQASNPEFCAEFHEADESLSDFIESLFPLHTEFALLIWNGMFVPLSYKYDISIIIEDILEMLECIMSSQTGNLEVTWPSNTFCSHWKLEWSDDSVSIVTVWTSVIGQTEEKLNNVPEVRLGKAQFIAEWAEILSVVYIGIKTAFASRNMPELTRLENILSQNKLRGILYSDE